MSCNCNSKRQSVQAPQTSSSYTPPDSAQTSFVRYRYIGSRSLTVTGGVTRYVYRFANPGDIALIDKRDVPGMTAVPNVEQVKD